MAPFLFAGITAAVFCCGVGFVVTVIRAMTGPVEWLAWPPRILIGLALLCSAGFFTAAAVFAPVVPASVAGGALLVLAAVLAWARWSLRRQVLRTAAILNTFHAPPGQGR